jgi:O-Glycosyl hydrolase
MDWLESAFKWNRRS